MRPRLSAGSSEARLAQGFVLIDVLAVLAIVALVAALAWPALMRETTSSGLMALTEDVVSLLKTSRTEALQTGRDTMTVIDVNRRIVEVAGRSLTLPGDVDIAVLAADSCRSDGAAVGILFRGDGTSCGGVIGLTHGGRGYRIRINWYTGDMAILRI